ncbi:hypothetical protein BC936DRAFT_148975 [Jimgerdemannia flammicorona]|uniref:Uncharacterized protein n=2 Tax=Jimgerdemannia flammicorona TaxID=994334 RepID=A0A433PEK3_9FUNG|nr:hypothetical protein BC936DRAFT_148975 [Jimgerdemannia flammicorona]RUS15964.1 hypothetical protein BC938DRAFT_476745 [Jimgerdemannia flammicorona]
MAALQQLHDLASFAVPADILVAFYQNDLSRLIVNVTANPTSFYRAADPLVSGTVIVAAVSFACWFVSVLARNYSQVDRLWSILPPFYIWHFALHDYLNGTGGLSPRLVLIALLTSAWGSRLTYNFARKGGYRWHDQDYRWPYLRKYLGLVLFQLLNITFIAPTQNILLFLITSPAYVAYQTRHLNPSLNALDFFAAALFLALLAGEALADQQQWAFQTRKYTLIGQKAKLTGDYARGFLSESGLWKYSRHPNFFCETSLWWAVYLFSVSATGTQGLGGFDGRWVNWSAVGTVLLTSLFQASTWFTEFISAQKYLAYKEYQQRVSRIIPMPSAAPKVTKQE